MKIYHSINEFPSNIKTIVTIGTFDGVHIGHQHIIDRLNYLSKKKNLESVLVTFNPHPRHVLFPEHQDLKLLNLLEEKIVKLEEAGLQHLVVHEFTRDFSRQKSVNFIRDFLINKLDMKHIVVGYNHHFGRNREGSIEELKELSELYSFHVEEVPVQQSQEISVSSTKIRNALKEGDIKKANQFLTYNYPLQGVVVHGEKIGRKIGYPTANIKIAAHKLIPKAGVYVVKVELFSSEYFGMLNISFNRSKIEVHIFDFLKDIYNQEIKIHMISYLREEKDFADYKLLKEQLIKDENNAKRLLNMS